MFGKSTMGNSMARPASAQMTSGKQHSQSQLMLITPEAQKLLNDNIEGIKRLLAKTQEGM